MVDTYILVDQILVESKLATKNSRDKDDTKCNSNIIIDCFSWQRWCDNFNEWWWFAESYAGKTQSTTGKGLLYYSTLQIKVGKHSHTNGVNECILNHNCTHNSKSMYTYTTYTFLN